MAPVTSGAKKLMIRPQLKIEAAVERRWTGYNSAIHGPQITLDDRKKPNAMPIRPSNIGVVASVR